MLVFCKYEVSEMPYLLFLKEYPKTVFLVIPLCCMSPIPSHIIEWKMLDGA